MRNLLAAFFLLNIAFSCKQSQEERISDSNSIVKGTIGLNLDKGAGIINTANSPHVKFKSINMGDCQWTEGFWADKFKVAEEVMVPHMGTILTGDIGHSLNNFKIAAGLKEGEHKGMYWHDGDFYKWMESAMYVYAQNRDEKILEELDKYIEIIGKAQAEDGYLQTQIQTDPSRKRYENTRFHEMYNTGHLLTSACIHHRISGKTNFLDIAIKHANKLYEDFAVDTPENVRFGFNQTQIMGLVELYRTTKDKRYLELAETFVNRRGKNGVDVGPTVRPKMVGDMVQERTPIREETEAVGHAVLALYYYAGAADIAAETGEKALIEALDRLWNSVVDKKMYVTGACGQTHHGSSSHQDMVHEAFIDDYMMPNLTAYNETCANVCNSMFSYRMLGLHGESKYADVMELVLFNSALSGISIEGKDYFYANPLRMIHNARDVYKSTESPIREPYIECFCCPPNLLRTITKMSGWAYSLSDNGVAVNLYGGNQLSTNLLDGSPLELLQETQYPWEGNVKITIENAKPEAFDVRLRIPDWAKGSKIRINGKDAGVAAIEGTYAILNRAWKKGDIIDLEMPMEIKKLEGHPRIEEVRNQAAIKRGPVVYCIESPDLPENTSILDVYLPADSELKATYQPDFLGGLTTISGDLKLRTDHKEGMYREMSDLKWKTSKTQFVPYFAWANRGQSEMTVWMPIIWE